MLLVLVEPDRKQAVAAASWDVIGDGEPAMVRWLSDKTRWGFVGRATAL